VCTLLFAASWGQSRVDESEQICRQQSRVASHPSAVVTQFIISCAVEILKLTTKIHLLKPLCSVSKLPTESVGSRREQVANYVDTADATQLSSCVALSTVCIGFQTRSVGPPRPPKHKFLAIHGSNSGIRSLEQIKCTFS